MGNSIVPRVVEATARECGIVMLYAAVVCGVLSLLAWCLAAGIMRRTAEDTRR